MPEIQPLGLDFDTAATASDVEAAIALPATDTPLDQLSDLAHSISGSFAVDGATDIDGEASPWLSNPLRKAINRVGGFVGFAVLSPLAVKGMWDVYKADGRPVFYSEERAGKNGEPITVWKIRSLFRNAGSQGTSQGMRDDRAVVDWVRETGVDESLQLLINVGIKGDMVVDGPRPTNAGHREVLHRVLGVAYEPHMARRLHTEPGIISDEVLYNRGLDAQGRTEDEVILKGVELNDRHYYEATPWTDIKRTFRAIGVVAVTSRQSRAQRKADQARQLANSPVNQHYIDRGIAPARLEDRFGSWLPNGGLPLTPDRW